LFNLYIYIVIW